MYLVDTFCYNLYNLHPLRPQDFPQISETQYILPVAREQIQTGSYRMRIYWYTDGCCALSPSPQSAVLVASPPTHLHINPTASTYPPNCPLHIQSTIKRVSFSGSLCHHHAFFKIPFESNSLKFIHICPLSNYSPSSGAFQAPSPYPALSSLPWSPPSPSSPISPTTKCRACCFFSLHHLHPTHHQSLATITPRPLPIFIDFSFYSSGIYIVAFSCRVFHFWPI